MTRFQLHVLNWRDCNLCELSSQRQRVVFYRGKLPCDVLFCGEAPGESEDALGQPFKGPAGKLLDSMIAEVNEDFGEGFRIGFTNIVACFPKQAKEEKNHQPPKEAVVACEDRLKEILDLASPQLVVCVGKLSAQWLHKQRIQLGLGDIKLLEIVHPAYIVRLDPFSQQDAIRKTITRIRTALEDLTPF